MPRKPADPLLAMAARGDFQKEVQWRTGGLPLDGLPGGVVWRELMAGEAARAGDYVAAGDTWQRVYAPLEPSSKPLVVMRPMGVGTRVLYVGSLPVGKVGNGSWEWPFESLKVAQAAMRGLRPGEACVARDKATNAVLDAIDPASWDWDAFEKQQELVADRAQVVEVDKLKEISEESAIAQPRV
jgi:hypothetical protein